MKVISENIANASSTASVKGGEPIAARSDMGSTFDHELNTNLVEAGKPLATERVQEPVRSRQSTADGQGYVKLPNVDSLVEVMDMRDAQRSYEADLSVMDAPSRCWPRP